MIMVLLRPSPMIARWPQSRTKRLPLCSRMNSWIGWRTSEWTYFSLCFSMEISVICLGYGGINRLRVLERASSGEDTIICGLFLTGHLLANTGWLKAKNPPHSASITECEGLFALLILSHWRRDDLYNQGFSSPEIAIPIYPPPGKDGWCNVPARCRNRF
jgi:hypothetical protein